MKQNKIITLTTLVTLSLSSTCAFAFTPKTAPTPRHSHTQALTPIANDHLRLANANTAMKQQEKASIRAAQKGIKSKRDVSRDGLNKASSEHMTKLIEARATHVKARIKKIDTTANYTSDSRDQDENKIDTLKTQFITEQRNK
ncbi:MAG: hypothetical protein KBC27_00405 [Rickettsiales bacterium]|nr:hypothetical protein [Rickettsiales bacterium]